MPLQIEGASYEAPSDGENRYPWDDGYSGWKLLELEHMQVRQETMPPGGSEEPHWDERAHQFFYVQQDAWRWCHLNA